MKSILKKHFFSSLFLHHQTAKCFILPLAALLMFPSCSKKAPIPEDSDQPSIQAQDPNADSDVRTDPIPEIQDGSTNDLQDNDTQTNRPISHIHPWRTYNSLTTDKTNIALNPLISQIPRTSQFVFASCAEYPVTSDAIEALLRHFSAIVLPKLQSMHADSQFKKSLRAFLRGSIKSFSADKLAFLGIADKTMPQFVFYIHKQIPVFRSTLADASKFQSIIKSYWNANTQDTKHYTFGGRPWMLIRLDNASEISLAVHWEPQNITLAIVGDTEQASSLLPEIFSPIAPDKSAIAAINAIAIDPDDIAIGYINFTDILNNQGIIRNQYEKFTGKKLEISSACQLDFRRLADLIPDAALHMQLISGNGSPGVRAAIDLNVKNSGVFKPLLKWNSQNLELPQTENMPILHFFTAIPMPIIKDIITRMQTASKIDPIKCPDIAKFTDFLSSGLMTQWLSKPAFADFDHFLSGAVYSDTPPNKEHNTDPNKDAILLAYQSETAAETALYARMIASPTLEKKFSQDGTSDTADDGTENAQQDSEANDAEAIYDDVTPGSWLKTHLPDSVSIFASDSRIILGNRSNLIQMMKSKPTVSSSTLFHIDISELKLMQDADIFTDYRISADIKTTRDALVLQLQYIIEAD